MTDTVAALAWCPFPDRESARSVSSSLLDEGLIGCANIVGDVESIFEWDGERGEGTETAVLFKTKSELLKPMIARLGELHPYDTPAIAGWHCDAAHPATSQWLGSIGVGKPE